MTRLQVEHKRIVRAMPPVTMDVYVLFGEEWKRQVAQAKTLLNDLDIEYDFYDTTSDSTARSLLWGLTGSGITPVLFINGVMYNGITNIRNQLT